MRLGHALRPHFKKLDGNASAGKLPGCFAPSQPTAYNSNKFCHELSKS
jgi:hypothetical protein